MSTLVAPDIRESVAQAFAVAVRECCVGVFPDASDVGVATAAVGRDFACRIEIDGKLVRGTVSGADGYYASVRITLVSEGRRANFPHASYSYHDVHRTYLDMRRGH